LVLLTTISQMIFLTPASRSPFFTLLLFYRPCLRTSPGISSSISDTVPT